MPFINKAIKYIAFEYGVISTYITPLKFYQRNRTEAFKALQSWHRKAFKAPFYRLLKARLTKLHR